MVNRDDLLEYLDDVTRDVETAQSGFTGDFALSIALNETPKLIAEIRRLLAEREWQPIETAPKDGTEILICVPTLPECEWMSPFDLASWAGDGWMIHDWGGASPTHWMPLPNPPEVTE